MQQIPTDSGSRAKTGERETIRERFAHGAKKKIPIFARWSSLSDRRDEKLTLRYFVARI